jgi:hypothetical protein
VKSLVTGKPQLFSIVAESNTDLLLIDKSTYLRVFQQDESNLAIILNFLLHEVRALRHIDRRCDTLAAAASHPFAVFILNMEPPLCMGSG